MEQQVTPGKMPQQEQLLHIPPAHGCPHLLHQGWSCPLPTWEAAEPVLGWSRTHPDEGWQRRCCSAASCSRSGCSPPPPSVAHSSHLSPPRLALEQERELGLVSSVLAHPQDGSTLGLVSVVQEGKNTLQGWGSAGAKPNLAAAAPRGGFCRRDFAGGLSRSWWVNC